MDTILARAMHSVVMRRWTPRLHILLAVDNLPLSRVLLLLRLAHHVVALLRHEPLVRLHRLVLLDHLHVLQVRLPHLVLVPAPRHGLHSASHSTCKEVHNSIPRLRLSRAGELSRAAYEEAGRSV